MKELANVRADIRDVKNKCWVKAYGGNEEEIEHLRIDLLLCRTEIKELKTELKIQNEYTNRLEEEKSSLVTGIKLLMQDNYLCCHVENSHIFSGVMNRNTQKMD